MKKFKEKVCLTLLNSLYFTTTTIVGNKNTMPEFLIYK